MFDMFHVFPYSLDLSFQKIIRYNPHIPNTDAISGALFTLIIQTQYDEGAKDGIDI